MTQNAAFFDIDGTLFLKTSMDRVFYKYLLKKGILGLDGLWNTIWFALRNFSKGKEYIVKKNKAYLKGKSVDLLTDLAYSCFREEIKPHILPQVRELILDHRSKGEKIIFLSASLQPLVDMWTFELEGDLGMGSHISECEGLFTGAIEGVHPYGEGKVTLLLDTAKEYHIDLSESFGYGEHYSDRFFMDKVGHPVALHPDSKLLKFAYKKGWAVIKEL